MAGNSTAGKSTAGNSTAGNSTAKKNPPKTAKNADPIRRIAINTGGGDAPGLNAVIQAVTLAALNRGWQVYGVERGYEGLLERELVHLNRDAVRGIAHRGGTILGTINKGNPFDFPRRAKDGGIETVDLSDVVVENFHNLGLDALVAIGGDGSMRIANRFADMGIPVVGVPKTIDNDLPGTLFTFGFQTAVDVATDAIGRLHSTAEAHQRVFVVEVMGRYAGWIALHAGMAGGADAILLPEIPFDIESVVEKIRDRDAHGRRFSIVVVAEGAKPKGGKMVVRGEQEAGREVRLGGIAEQVAAAIEKAVKKETRTVVLGHLQRGGEPVAFDRLIALRFGAAAVRLVEERRFGHMVALDPPDITAVPLADAIGTMKNVDTSDDTVQTARELGICLGD